MDKFSIPSADFPEQVGVDSKEIKALIDEFKEKNIQVHSMMIIRDGKIAAECHSAPYGRDVPHAMYSVSKSFTSAAIAFAIDEGLISYDTRVIDIFPMHTPVEADENLQKLTVRHLITMTSGKNTNLFSDRRSKDWIADFFDAPWYNEPGKEWRYINENTYICSAIIRQVTGMGLVDYLTPRLFKPLGIERRPQWDTDTKGIEAGGWGSYFTIDELARFILCVMNGGKYAGKQILPAEYIKDAILPLVDSSVGNKDADGCKGYGYFFWQSRFENTPRADGMFSQFGMMFLDYNAAFIFTASEVNECRTEDVIFAHLPKAFIEKTDKKPDEEIELKLDDLPVLPACEHCLTEQLLKSKVIITDKNPILKAAGYPTSVIPFTHTFLSSDRGGFIDHIIFDFEGDDCIMKWDEGKAHNEIRAGMDGKPRFSEIDLCGTHFHTASTATWRDYDTLEIWIRPLESVCERRLVFKMNLLKLTAEIKPSSYPGTNELGKGVAAGVAAIMPGKVLKAAAKGFMGNLGAIIDSPIKAKIKL